MTVQERKIKDIVEFNLILKQFISDKTTQCKKIIKKKNSNLNHDLDIVPGLY